MLTLLPQSIFCTTTKNGNDYKIPTIYLNTFSGCQICTMNHLLRFTTLATLLLKICEVWLDYTAFLSSDEKKIRVNGRCSLIFGLFVFVVNLLWIFYLFFVFFGIRSFRVKRPFRRPNPHLMISKISALIALML